MKIVEYDPKYNEQIKDLLVELQNYLIDIDNWHTQVMLPEYRENYFKMDMMKVKKIDCKRINIEVFGLNKKGLNFYNKNGYIIRDMIVSKRI